MEIWEPKPPGNLWATPGLLRDCCIFLLLFDFYQPFEGISAFVLNTEAGAEDFFKIFVFSYQPNARE